MKVERFMVPNQWVFNTKTCKCLRFSISENSVSENSVFFWWNMAPSLKFLGKSQADKATENFINNLTDDSNVEESFSESSSEG